MDSGHPIMIFTWACFIATAIPAIAMLWGPPWSPGKTAPLIFSSKSYMIFLPSAPVDWTPKKKQAQKGNSKKRVCWSIQYEIYRSNGWFRVKKQGNDFLNKCDLNVPLVWPCTATFCSFWQFLPVVSAWFDPMNEGSRDKYGTNRHHHDRMLTKF